MYDAIKNARPNAARDSLHRCQTAKAPAGCWPDPHRPGYVINPKACVECGEHTWSVLTPWRKWYNSPFCHVCLDLDMSRPLDEQAEERAERNAEQALRNAGLTPADLAHTYTLIDQLRGFERHHTQWCAYLLGSTGTGKTSQAIQAIKTYTRAGWRCRYVTEADALALLKPGGMDLDHLASYDLLVLDEFGSAGHTQWQQGTIRALIDSRYRQRLPTIFCSNHSLHTLAKKEGLGRLVIERIFEGCRPVDGGGVLADGARYAEFTHSYRIGRPAALPEGAEGLKHRPQTPPAQ